MTSAHKHHALQLDKEHVLSAWLEFKNQAPAFLSCTLTADDQVFVFVMNYDINRRRFSVVLKHVGSLCKDTCAKKNISTQNRKEVTVPTKKKSKPCELTTESENCQEKLNTSRNRDVAQDKVDSFERTGHERIFRGEQSCDYGYLVELMDNKCIQALRFVQTALNKEDALDLAVKSGRCLGVDLALIDRLLEPGNGLFTVKITISRIKTNAEDAFATSVGKNVKDTVLPRETAPAIT